MKWLPVAGFEPFYEVSDEGKIRRNIAGHFRMVSTERTNRKGYEVVEFCVNDEKTRQFVHRVVATAFHGKIPSVKHMVNHKDGNKRNNRADNLEWVTAKENTVHAWNSGLCKPMRGEMNGRSKLTAEQACEIRNLKGVIGAREIAKRFNVSRSTVQQIHQRKKWPEDLRVQEFPFTS